MSWPTVSIGSVAKVITGKTPPKADPNCFGGNIPFITPSELTNSDYLLKPETTLTEKGLATTKLIPKNSILVCCIGSLGKIAIANLPVATNQQINSVTFDEDKIYYRFGFYALKLLKNELKNIAPSTTVAIVNKSRFSELKIPHPPLEEQKRIADILDKAAGIRQKREQATKLADDFLRATFLAMFGDPVVNEKKWPLRKLKDVCDNVIDCPHSTPKWVDNGTICIRTSNLSKGGWVWSDKRFVSEDTYLERTKRSVVDEGDIILSREGTVGIAAIVPENLKLCMGQRLVQLKLDKNQVTPEYLLAFLLYELDPVRISRVMSGSTSKHINVSELKQLNVMLPSMKKQKLFSEIRNKIINISNKSNVDSSLFEVLSSQFAY
ncbi:restriction endonuclease subunit S [Serratia sp. PL7]|uniref:restriction endonuclease subunit S n=1 Tax=Serratia sp. PL7 TaxID=2952201 RepID=UPI0019FCF625|nr:restriction endonuclease subunit S [Serratia sp. PL7]MBE0148642.1 restriction endonuclease [Serratia fonticola]